MAVPKWQKDLLDQYNQGLITADDYNVLVQQHKIDAILGDIEQKTHEAYKQASEEMAKKAEKRLEKFWKKYEEQRQLSIDGKITKQEFESWIKRQTAMNQDLQNLAEVLAKDMHQTNLIAAKIAKDQMADVYAYSANYEMYTLESMLGGDYFKGQAGLNFALYNHDTAEILLKEEQKSLLPAPSKKKLKELKQLKKTNPDVLWNMQKMQSAILQSVLQGEGALDIAKRISAVGLMNEHQAIRNARTMTTNVQNMGHNRAYLNAKDMGIKLTIQWYAVLDNRTRHSHRQMHGQTKKNLKTAKFSNGCRWPGDPEGPAEEVYNCRCTTVAWTEGMEEAVPEDSAWLQQNNMTFDEWLHDKEPKNGSAAGALTSAPTSGMVDDRFSDARRAAAKRFDDRYDADDYYRPQLDAEWNNLTEYEQYSAWQYTHNSNPINKSLSGYHDSWSRSSYIGPANTDWGHEDNWRSFDTANFRKKFGKPDGHVDYHKTITNLTNAIQKSTLQEDAFFVRGGGYGGLAGMLENGGLPFDDVYRVLESGSRAERDALIARVKGQTFQEHGFLSTGVAKGSGFSGKVKYSIYAPKGTHAIYCEPTSYYGSTISGEQLYKKGMARKGVGSEAEMLFQRGSSYRFKDIEIHSNGEVLVKLEVKEQPNYFRFGDEDTFNGGKTRHRK